MIYTIQNFAKGLVGQEAQAQLTDDYRNKCSELKNMYIAKNKNVQIRPPIKLFKDLGSEIRDYILTDDRLITIRDITVEDVRLMHVELRQRLFYEHIIEGPSDVLFGTQALMTIPFSDDPSRSLSASVKLNLRGGIIESFDMTRPGKPQIEDETFLLAANALETVDGINPPTDSFFERINNQTEVIPAALLMQALLTDTGKRSALHIRARRNYVDTTNYNRFIPLDPVDSVVVSHGFKARVEYEHGIANQIHLNGFDTFDYFNILFPSKPKLIGESKVDFKPKFVRDTSGKIEIVFAGHTYIIDKGIKNKYSEQLLPELAEVDKKYISNQPEVLDETLHAVEDYPIEILDIQLNTQKYELRTKISTSDDRAASGNTANIHPSKLGFDSTATGNQANSNSIAKLDPVWKETLVRDEDYELGNIGTSTFGKITVRTSLDKLFDETPALSKIRNYLRPVITDYNIRDHTQSSDSQVDAPKQVDRATANLFPDFKALATDTDYPASFMFSYNDDNQKQHNVFAVALQADPKGPIVLDQSDGYAIPNSMSCATLGVTIKIQTDNKEDIEGVPIYAQFGDLMVATGSADPVNVVRKGGESDTVSVIKRVVKRRYVDKMNKGQTVRTLFMIYKYSFEMVREYFKNKPLISSLVNGGDELREVSLSRLALNSVEEVVSGTTINTMDIVIEDSLAFFKAVPRRNGLGLEVQAAALEALSYNSAHLYSRDAYFILLPIAKTNRLMIYSTPYQTSNLKALLPKLTNDINDLAFPLEATYFGVRFTASGLSGSAQTSHISLLNAADATAKRTFYNEAQGFTVALGDTYMDVSRSIFNKDRSTVSSGWGGAWFANLFSNPDIGVTSSQTDRILSPWSLMAKDREVRRSFYFAAPTFHRSLSRTPVDLRVRKAVLDDNTLNLSGTRNSVRPELIDRFANHIANYLTSFENTVRLNPKIYLESGIDVLDTTLTAASPRDFSFFTERAGKDQIKSIISERAGQLFLGLENSIRTFTGGVSDPTSDVKLSGTGSVSDIVFESGYILSASEKDINKLNFYEEAQDYVADIANDTYPIEGIVDVESLFDNHRLFFFANNTNNIYALSIGSGRAVRGLSRFTVPGGLPVSEIRRISKNTILLRAGSKLLEMDFRSDKDTSYIDLDDNAFEIEVSTLPVFHLTDIEYSVFNAISVAQIALSLSGIPELEISILDQDGNRTVTVPVNRNEIITQPEFFSGPLLISMHAHNAGQLPRVSLHKTTPHYISFSSMVLDLGNRGDQEVGHGR